jgi:hypothetical protein
MTDVWKEAHEKAVKCSKDEREQKQKEGFDVSEVKVCCQRGFFFSYSKDGSIEKRCYIDETKQLERA